jgi:hypothetical protein
LRPREEEMAKSRELINGVDGSTGEYLGASPSAQVKPALTPRELRQYRWWIERHGIDDPNRAPVRDVDPLKISSAGWGVIWGPDVTAEMRDALQPLILHRKNEAGNLFFSHEFGPDPAKTKQDFLALHGAGPGPADPKKIPYYLLIVGDPRNIPFSFQYELDVQYAVGRLHFETGQEYENYAKGVIDVEARKKEVPLPPKLAAFFGVRNRNDPGTERTALDLVAPLVRSLRARPHPVNAQESSWSLVEIIGEPATKGCLERYLGGPYKPSFLFTACHGVAFSRDPEKRVKNQGALLCQDWPGPKWTQPLLPEHYFSADDISADADLRGLIAFHFACYSAGTPDLSSFDRDPMGTARTITPHPFLSRLAKRLLGHPKGGALAVVGHVDRAWTTSFSYTEDSQIEVFDSTIKCLLDGHPVGSAMEYVNQRHAELSVDLSTIFMAHRDTRNQDQNQRQLQLVWKANNDARNFVVLGDPAVRLTWAE